MNSYETVEEIGHGADGTVHKVYHIEKKKFYAMKVVRLNEKSKMRNSKTIADEAKILSGLKHPHIVASYDAFFTEDGLSYCLVLDLCDAGTLEHKIQEAIMAEKQYEEDEIMHWFVQLCSAVQYLHSQKVLHRDLKTENVFLTRKNVVKLGDFGISKCLSNTMDLATTCCGTPCYISPELCQDQPYSSKADIWALGCLLYEVCVLEPAFIGTNPLSLIFKIVKADYVPLPSRFSNELRDVMKQLLAKQPEDRPTAISLLANPFIKQHMSRFMQFTEKQKADKLARKQSGLNVTSVSAVEICKEENATIIEEPVEHIDYEDDFEDEDNTNEGNSGPVQASQDVIVDESQSDVEYEDDFEECSSVGDYDDLLNTAKNAFELELQISGDFEGDGDYEYEFITFNESTGFECRNRLREECRRALEDSKTESDLKDACRGIMEEVG